jgi:hypothetical protein
MIVLVIRLITLSAGLATTGLRNDGIRIEMTFGCKNSHLRRTGILCLSLLTGSMVISAVATCVAQVQLPGVNLGDTNFEDGFAGPGWLLEEFPDGYVASELKDAYGEARSGSHRVTTYSTTTHVAFISQRRLFRGWLVGEALQPLVDLDVQLANGTNNRVRGFADLIVGTGLQWAPKKFGKTIFVQRAMVDVDVPTGQYSDARPLNIGNHFFVVNPYYAFTYEHKRVEFSARVHYLWNSTNHDPFVRLGIKNMQPGQALHANYATSYEVVKGIRLGFNGYWLQQLTDHQIDSIGIPDSKERTVGLGPGFQVAGVGIWFRVNSYLETDVRNRPSGIKVTFRISKALAAERSAPQN